MTEADARLTGLLRHLHSERYRFVTPTPATHGRNLARADRWHARSLRDALGWSLPFAPGAIDPAVETALRAAAMLDEADGIARSRLRVSSLGDLLFLHSSYPTEAEDAVFFGPDSYRFAALIEAELGRAPVRSAPHIVDIGTGAGVGGIVAARLCPNARITLTDINPKALRLARVNAAAAGLAVRTIAAAGLDALDAPIDLALANPPYLIDEGERAYRHGGGLHGGQASLEMARMAAERLAPDGRLILYTGAAIVAGRSALAEALTALADEQGCDLALRELDPDVFGEELDNAAYADVERIALIAAILRRR